MAILPGLVYCVLYSEILGSLTVSTNQVEKNYYDLSADDQNEVNVDYGYGGQVRKREVQVRHDKIYWKDNSETQKYGQGAVVTKVLYHGIYPSLNVTEEISERLDRAQSNSSHRIKRSGNFSRTDSWMSSSSHSQRYSPPGSVYSSLQDEQSFSAGHSTYTQSFSSSGSTWINGQLVTTTTKQPLTTRRYKNLISTKKSTPTTTRKPKTRYRRWSGKALTPSSADEHLDAPRVSWTYIKKDEPLYEQYYSWLTQEDIPREDPSKFKIDLNNRRTEVETGVYYRFNDTTDDLRSYHNPPRLESSFISAVETNGIADMRQNRALVSGSFNGWRNIPRQPKLYRGNEQLRQSISDPIIRYRRFSGFGNTGTPSNPQQSVPSAWQASPSLSKSADQPPYVRAKHSNSPGFYRRQQGPLYNSSKQAGAKYRTLYVPETNKTEYKGDPYNKGHVKLVSVAYYSSNVSSDAMRSYHNTRNKVGNGVRRKRDTWSEWLNGLFEKIGLSNPDPPSDIPQSEPLVMSSDVNEIDQITYGFSSNGNGHADVQSGTDSLSKEQDSTFVESDEEETERTLEELHETIEDVTAKTVIIQAPQKRIICKPPKKRARGRCRTVW